jgi:hypothetical protein
MNMVERFFLDLSQQAILPGSFGSVAELVDAQTLIGYLFHRKAAFCRLQLLK